MAKHTVKQVARLSGVSVRALHHYDAIGLLKPTEVGGNGYRYYDRPALLRLQQILFYRRLGMPLSEIKRTLDAPDFNAAAALRQHRQRLLDDIEHQHRLVRTIDETLDDINGDRSMKDKDTFNGFTPEKQAEYEGYLVGRYGEQAREKIESSKARAGKLSKEQMASIQADGDEINRALVEAIDAGAAPGDEPVQGLVARHHAWVSHFWVPDSAAYTGLGRLYAEHADFRAHYDKFDARLVEFLTEAMAIYAENELS